MSKLQLSKETNKVFWRWYFLGGAGWNYEKMQGLGYYFSTLPLIKKLYKNEDDLKKAWQMRIYMIAFRHSGVLFCLMWTTLTILPTVLR